MKSRSSNTRLFEWLVFHRNWTFTWMCASFVLFGALSVNMVSHFSANANYLLTYRLEALLDGGFVQLVELCLKSIGALGCYLSFKLCEHALIHRLAHGN